MNQKYLSCKEWETCSSVSSHQLFKYTHLYTVYGMLPPLVSTTERQFISFSQANSPRRDSMSSCYSSVERRRSHPPRYVRIFGTKIWWAADKILTLPYPPKIVFNTGRCGDGRTLLECWSCCGFLGWLRHPVLHRCGRTLSNHNWHVITNSSSSLWFWGSLLQFSEGCGMYLSGTLRVLLP